MPQSAEIGISRRNWMTRPMDGIHVKRAESATRAAMVSINKNVPQNFPFVNDLLVEIAPTADASLSITAGITYQNHTANITPTIVNPMPATATTIQLFNEATTNSVVPPAMISSMTINAISMDAPINDFALEVTSRNAPLRSTFFPPITSLVIGGYIPNMIASMTINTNAPTTRATKIPPIPPTITPSIINATTRGTIAVIKSAVTIEGTIMVE